MSWRRKLPSGQQIISFARLDLLHQSPDSASGITNQGPEKGDLTADEAEEACQSRPPASAWMDGLFVRLVGGKSVR